MPAQFVANHGNSSNSGAPLVVTLASNVPAGNTLVAITGTRGSTSQYSPADSPGLAWQKFSATGSNRSAVVAYAYATTAIPAGTQITVDIGTNSGGLYILEFSGLSSQTHTSSSSGTSTNSSGNVTYLPGDLVIGSTSIAGTDTPAAGAPFTGLTPAYLNAGTKSTSYTTEIGGYYIPTTSGSVAWNYTGIAGTNVAVTLQAVENIGGDIPKNLTAIRTGTSVALSWTPAANPVDAYYIVRIDPLLTGDNRDFTNSLGTWGPDLASIVTYGNSSLIMEATGTSTTRAGPGPLPVTVGLEYTMAAKAKTLVGQKKYAVGFNFLDSTGASVDDGVSTSYLLPASDMFSTLTVYTAVAPAGAVTVTPLIYGSGGITAIGDRSEWDEIDFGTSATVSVPNGTTSYTDTVPSATTPYVYRVYSMIGTSRSATTNAVMLSSGSQGHGQLVGVPL